MQKGESSPAGFAFDGLHQLGSQPAAPAPAMDHELGNVAPVGLVGCPGWLELYRPDDAHGIPGHKNNGLGVGGLPPPGLRLLNGERRRKLTAAPEDTASTSSSASPRRSAPENGGVSRSIR